MAVAHNLQGYLLLTNYSRIQHRTQAVFLHVLCISKTEPLGKEKVGIVLNKLK